MPEGDHVPMVLNRILHGTPSEKHRILDSLAGFGARCGLFDGIAIKRFGESDSDPFHVQIKVSGSAFNFVDVGFGVSQALPILI
ncbi:MAG: hypothetical protein IH998_10570, partial [Proteobacteria bacterium]|nr:hypothetical protein [Pseudomonadota bacterium]